MSETVKVVVDVMGGDNAPTEPVKAAAAAVEERSDIEVILTGDKDVIEKELEKYTSAPKERIHIVPTTEVIETAEPPVMAIRKKKGFLYCSWSEYGEKAGSRCVCFFRKLRSSSRRRSGYCRKEQRCGTTSAGAVDPDGRRCLSPCGLWSECRCTSFPSRAVCKNGFDLHGAYCGSEKSESRYCK